MKKTVLWKATAFAVVLALVLAALPTVSVFAANDSNKQIEQRWKDAVTTYEKQAMAHNAAHRLAENILNEQKMNASEKAEVQRHLATCNSALANAKAVVTSHPGFNASGKVLDRAQALNSIKLLRTYVNQHNASIKNIKEHAR